MKTRLRILFVLALLSCYIVLAATPAKLEIVLDKQTLTPGDSIKIKALSYDDLSNEVRADVNIIIKDSFDELYLDKTVSSGEQFGLDFPTNTTAGYWKIEASSDNIKTKRLFYIEEMEKAKFEILNDTLIIQNIGNAPYRRTVQIAIGEDLEVKEMDLDIGEEKKFRLVAPHGLYKVVVTDGKETLTLADMSLTGNVIGVSDIQKQVSSFNRYPIVWLFLIVVFALFLLVMVEKVSHHTFYGFDETKPFIEEINSSGFYKDFKPHNLLEAEQAAIIQGNKQDVSVLAIKIRNLGEMNDKGKVLENLSKGLEQAGKHKGSLFRDSSSLMLIFSPELTKSFKNDLIAVKTAKEIASNLESHNQDIDFGIGIHSGKIISKLENGKLKFASLGNTLSMAKKAADSSKNNVLLSKEVEKNVMSEVKSQRSGEFYAVSRIVDREQHKKFIDGFMKRNK